MNAYFSRTPDDFNYDNQQYPGQGDLHDLRVATREVLEQLETDMAFTHGKLIKRIKLLENTTRINELDIAYNEEHIHDLEAVEKVDRGKYDHLTEAHIALLVTALRAYADTDKAISAVGIHLAEKVLRAVELDVEAK